MKKLRTIGVKMRQEKNGTQVLETKLVEVPVPCKQCGKEPRQQGSSRCQRCSDAYRAHQGTMSRLEHKKQQQLKK